MIMPQPLPSSLTERILKLFTSSTLLYSRDTIILFEFVFAIMLVLFFVAIMVRKVSFRAIVFPNAAKITLTLALLALLGIPYRFGNGYPGSFILRKLWDFNPVFYDLTPQYIFDPLAFVLYAVLIYGVVASIYHVLGLSARETGSMSGSMLRK